MSELSRHQGQNGQNQARGRERPVLRANENNADGEMMVVELSHQQGTSGGIQNDTKFDYRIQYR